MLAATSAFRPGCSHHPDRLGGRRAVVPGRATARRRTSRFDRLNAADINRIVVAVNRSAILNRRATLASAACFALRFAASSADISPGLALTGVFEDIGAGWTRRWRSKGLLGSRGSRTGGGVVRLATFASPGGRMSPVGGSVSSRLGAQRGGARKRAWARAKTAWYGQADAMAILIRRTETVTRAPIFKSFRRIVPQVAVSNSVC